MVRLNAHHICFAHDENTILKDIDIQSMSGEFIGLVGPNGAGKSTLLRVLAGLVQPASGRVTLVEDNNVEKLLTQYPAQERARLLAYLPQQEVPAWPLQVEHLVGLGRAPWRKPMSSKTSQDRDAVERALALTELTKLRERRVTTLSGGELQRALLARVFAGEPRIILADEPTTALDPYHQLHMMELLAEHVKTGGTVIAALHDLSMAARFCTRLVLLQNGSIVADGQSIEVLTTENLERVYGISAYVDCREEGVVIIPHKRIFS